MQDFLIPKAATNIGGAQTFYYVADYEVEFLPDPIDHCIASPLILRQGAQWHKGYASPRTLSFTETEQHNAAGSFFQKKVSGFYPGIIPDMMAMFSNMRDGRFLVLIRDNNNRQRLLGTLRQPLLFSFSLATGELATHRNGASFEFRGEDVDPSPFYLPDGSVEGI